MDEGKLQELLKKRREIAERLRVIKEGGDLSENAAYSYALEELTIIDNEIALLKSKKKDEEHALVGVHVELQNLETKKTERYDIVSHGVNPQENKISPQSPLVQALEGKQEGDDMAVTIGTNVIRYKILKIKPAEKG